MCLHFIHPLSYPSSRSVAHIRAGTILNVFPYDNFPALEAAKKQSRFDSPLLSVVEQWLKEDLKAARESRRKHASSETTWDRLSDMKKHGDKYYNYYDKEY